MDENTDTTAMVAGADSPAAGSTDETERLTPEHVPGATQASPPPDDAAPEPATEAPARPAAEEIADAVTEATEDPAVAAIADAIAETSPEPAGAEAAESAPAGTLSREEILSEVEQIAATPDETDGKQPDDRKLIDRLKALDVLWQASTEATEADKELRRRYDTAKKTYAAARARRAELRAVTRARAGETKRGLLVEAFTLARIVDPEKVKVPTPSEPVKRAPRRLNRPSPAMFAKRPSAPADAEPATPAPAETGVVAPSTDLAAAEATEAAATEPTTEEASA